MNKEKLKSFILGTAKLAAALIIVVLVVALIAYSITSYRKYNDKKLEEVKAWPSISIPDLKDSQFTFLTIWRDEQLLYQLKMRGYPKERSVAYTTRPDPYNSTYGSFTIVLHDKNLFKLGEHEIKIRGMMQAVDDKGNIIGLDMDGSFFISADNYRQAKYWNLLWTF